MADEIVFVVERDQEDGGYTASSARFSIFTQAETMNELREMVKQAVACRFEGETAPGSIRLHVVHDEVIAG